MPDHPLLPEEPVPDGAPSAPAEKAPAPPPRRTCWRRLRVYTWAILLVLALDFNGAIRLVREQPKRIVDFGLARLSVPASVGSAQWLLPQRLELRDIKVGGFFYADSVIVTATPLGLWRHRVQEVDVMGPQLFTRPLNNMLAKNTGSSRPTRGLDWAIGRLMLQRGTVMLDDLAPGLPSIPVRLGVYQPIILRNIQLGDPRGALASREEMVEIQNVNIVSPFDPLVPVLSFPLTRIRFSYGELWHHHIREIDQLRPVLHLGQDFFWFSEEIRKTRATATPVGVEAPWEVGHFRVRYGQLAVNVFGQQAVQFPFFFDTDVDNIRLDQLDKISAKSVLAIRRLDQDYPDYKVQIVNLSGKLEFSLPPSDARANNVVPTLHVDELSWNGIAATDVWSSVTFDPDGIYGKLGGNCEAGYLKGNFEVYYTKGFLWNAELFADKINCAPIAEKLAGKYVHLTGTLDGKIAITGQATVIQRCHGALDLAHPGLLQILSVDELMRRFPAGSKVLKDQAARIGLEAFRLYPYATGALNVDYAPQGGQAKLKLTGPRGNREFSVYLHPYPESSKVANAEGAR